MRLTLETEIDTVDGKATFVVQALSAFKAMAVLNKLLKFAADGIVPDDIVASMTRTLALLTEAQLQELCNLLLTGSVYRVNGNQQDLSTKKLDYLFRGNLGGLFVLLTHAIVLNYENFPSAFGQLKPMLESLFPPESASAQ
ncbi:MAG: hypothetical protein E6R03_17925 [Hyphomicrobiaceae bacterium]|nr:MAG: hypothetical protein E6R03_17925 [Hyphomicrobiaceae bacterium]